MASSSPHNSDLPPTNISDEGQNKDDSIILLSDKSTSNNVISSKPQLDEGQNKDGSTNISDEGQSKDTSIILLSDKSTSDNAILSKPQSDEGQNEDGSTNISDVGQNKDASIILLSDKSTSDNVISSKPQLDEGQNKDGSTNILDEGQNKDGSIILLSDKSTSDNVILSKRQLAQRARREREKLERPPSLPRFFPSLTPSRRQRAQLERAKSKRICIQSSTVSEKIPEVAVTDVSGPSTATIIQSDRPFSCRDNDCSTILSSNKTTGDNVILSKRQSGQRARRELANRSGPSMTSIIQSDLPFNCRNKDGSIILASNKPIGDNVILSKYQLEQCAQQEHERLERSPCLSRFFPLTPSCRQRAQLEREKSESSLIQSSTVSMKIPEVAVTNVSGPSMTTIIHSVPPFYFRNKVGSIILSSKKLTCDKVRLSKRQSAQRVRREREKLESKRAIIQSSTVSEKTPDVVVTNVSGPSMTTVIQSDPPFSCRSKDGSVILLNNKVVDKPTGDVILSNRQAGQRARRERERFGRSPILPRFFPSLTPSRRQRAQIERAKSKRALTQASIGSPENAQLAVTNVPRPSVTTIIPSVPPFSSSEKTTKTVEEFHEESSQCSLEKPEVGVELTMDPPSVSSSSKITMTQTVEEFHDEPRRCSLEKPEAVEEVHDEPSQCSLEKLEVHVEITVPTSLSGSTPENSKSVEEFHDDHWKSLKFSEK